MTPILHDSDEWRELMRDVTQLKVGQTAMQHQMNEQADKVEHLSRILIGDENNPGLKTLMYSMNSNLRLIKWLIAALIAGLTAYYASRDVHGLGQAQYQPPAYSLFHSPQSAGNSPAFTAATR